MSTAKQNSLVLFGQKLCPLTEVDNSHLAQSGLTELLGIFL